MRLLVYFLFVGITSASAASFDCNKASRSIEKNICSNPTLSKLDEAMAKNYKGALHSNIGDGARRHLKNSHIAWLRERNNCKTVMCIEAKYRERIDALCEYPVIDGVNWGCSTTADEIK